MPDAPAAPAAAPAAVATATPADGSAVAGKPAAAPVKPGAPRANDGRFLPKDGNASTDAPPPGETAEEKAYRFKRSLKVYGREEAVDLGEDDIARELQELRAMRKREKDARQHGTTAQRVLELAQKDPAAFLKEFGHDIRAMAKQDLLAEAQRQVMTPEELAIAERDEKIAKYEAAEKQRVESAKTERQKQMQAAQVKRNEELFLPAMEASGLPKTHETLHAMAETALAALEDGIEYTPQELARETQRRLDEKTGRYLGGLKGQALLTRLGPTLAAEVVRAYAAEFERTQTSAATTPPPERPAQSASDEREPYIDDAEVKRRMRGITG